MLFQIKKFSGKLLYPLGGKLSKIQANNFTLISFICSILTGIGYYFKFLPVIITFLFLIEFFDQLDGVVARIQGSTLFGAFWDSTLDRYGDFVIFFGIILSNTVPTYLGLIVILGAFLTSYTRARIEALKIKSMGGIGLIERTDRIPILFIGAIIQIWIPTAILWTMIILAVLTNITAIQRIIYANSHLSHKNLHED